MSKTILFFKNMLKNKFLFDLFICIYPPNGVIFWGCFFPKPTAQGSRLDGSVSRSRLRIARRQLPYHWQALLGSSMGPKTQRRHVNDTVGDVARGKPYHWQAFAASCIFRRRTANDAVVTTDCGLPHHWHDIGTEFLIFHCFATKMLLLFCKSMIPVRFESSRRDL